MYFGGKRRDPGASTHVLTKALFMARLMRFLAHRRLAVFGRSRNLADTAAEGKKPSGILHDGGDRVRRAAAGGCYREIPE